MNVVKKESKFIIFVTALIFSLVVSLMKAEFLSKDFFIFLVASFSTLSIFSSAFYFFNPDVNYYEISIPIQAHFDDTGISFLQRLSFLPLWGKKRILFAILIQIIFAVLLVYFL